jgi:hypothetical protein
MTVGRNAAFTVRLRDLLATLESAALMGASENRLRGLGEQLQFACLALPCSEALVALEVSGLGRMQVPGVASPDRWRATDLEFLPSGTPFAYLLGGGGGYGAEVKPDDDLLDAIRPALGCDPRHVLFVPVRVGGSIVGGAALLSDDELYRAGSPARSDDALAMAERLAEVLALTLESYRTERVLLQVFAQLLPDLCAPDAPTGFAQDLETYLHDLRLAPAYRRRLALAQTIGEIAAQGESETELVVDLLHRFQRYIAELTDPEPDDSWHEPLDDLLP